MQTHASAVTGKFLKLKARIVVQDPFYAPRACKDKKIPALYVLHPLSIMRELERFRIKALILDPPYLLIRKGHTSEVTAVLILDPVIQHLELKDSDRTDYHSLHT